MVVGLVLIANVAAVISGILAFIWGADNIVLIVLLAGHGAPLIYVAGYLLWGWLRARPAPTVPVDDVAARP